MKKFRLLSAVLVMFTVLGLVSCDTEPVDPVLNPGGENPGTNPVRQPVFKVDFSGQTYVATNTIATVGSGLITIGGVKGTNGEMVSIVISGTAQGTYSGENVMMDYNPGNSEYSYSNLFVSGADAGSVTISSINTQNKTISGTFQFKGEWTDSEANMPSVIFTNGVFENIPYTGAVDTEEEFFDATVDGTDNSYAGSDLAVVVAGAGAGETISINTYGENHKLVFSFPTTITAGTYTFATGPSATVGARFIDANNESHTVMGGSLTITSNANGWVAGSFSYTVDNHVVSGDFNVEWDF